MGSVAGAVALADPVGTAVCLLSAISGGILAFALLPSTAGILLERVAARAGAVPGAEGEPGAPDRGGPPSARALSAAVFAIACGWAAWVSYAAGSAHDPLASVGALCWLAVWAAVLMATACDLAARSIPRETCYLAGAAGIVFQALGAGARSIVAGAAFGGVVVAFCLLCNRVAARRGSGMAVGGGDVRCMMALSLASGFGAFDGFAACFLTAAAGIFVGVALRAIDPGTAVPLAPFFCVWAAFGMGAPWL